MGSAIFHAIASGLTPHMSRFQFFEIFEKTMVKLLLFFNRSCNFAVLLDLESLIHHRPTLFHEKYKNSYRLAVITT